MRDGRKGSSITVLLILSAIDMLSAALVCSVVLFVVLVGGQATEGDTAGSTSFAAPSLLFVYSPQGKPTPMPAGLEPTSPADVVSDSDRYTALLLGGPRVARQMFVLRAGSHQVSFSSSDSPFAIELYRGAGEPIQLLVGCQRIDQPLSLSFANAIQFTGSCPSSDTSPMQLPPHSHIRLALGSDQPLPADWAIESATPGIGRNSQIFTLRPRNDAVAATLTGTGRIVQVLE